MSEDFAPDLEEKIEQALDNLAKDAGFAKLLKKGRRRLELMNKIQKACCGYSTHQDARVKIWLMESYEYAVASLSNRAIKLSSNNNEILLFSQGDEEQKMTLERIIVHEYAHNIDPFLLILGALFLQKYLNRLLPESLVNSEISRNAEKNIQYISEKYAVNSADDICANAFGEYMRREYENARMEVIKGEKKWTNHGVVDGAKINYPLFTRCDLLRDYLDRLLEDISEGLESGTLTIEKMGDRPLKGWEVLIKDFMKKIKLAPKEPSDLIHPTDHLYYQLALQKEIAASERCGPSKYSGFTSYDGQAPSL